MKKKSNELKLLRKKLENSNTWSYILNENGFSINSRGGAASKHEDTMKDLKIILVIDDNEIDEVSVMMKYWNGG